MIDPRRFHAIRTALTRRQPDLTLLLDQVHKPHNLAAILRSCDAAGLLDAHAVTSQGSLRVGAHTSGGTKKWVRLHTYSSIGAVVEEMKKKGFVIVAADQGPGAVDFRECDFTRPVAIMMGAELHGVSDRGLELADERIEIPMLGMAHSLNVSVAAAVILFEAARQRAAMGMYEASRLPTDEFKRLLFEWTYPRQAAVHRASHQPYPALGTDGEILSRPSPRPSQVET